MFENQSLEMYSALNLHTHTNTHKTQHFSALRISSEGSCCIVTDTFLTFSSFPFLIEIKIRFNNRNFQVCLYAKFSEQSIFIKFLFIYLIYEK